MLYESARSKSSKMVPLPLGIMVEFVGKSYERLAFIADDYMSSLFAV